VTQVLIGEPVSVEERRDGWAQIRTAYDYSGWMRVDVLGGEVDPGWMSGEGGDPVERARAYLGTPYEWGGMTERGIDCSGLVHMAYRRTGRLVPRDDYQQAAAGEEVAEGELRPGDLVWYHGHIAFWLGEGRILHSTERDGANGVVEEPEPAELRPHFRGYIRL